MNDPAEFLKRLFRAGVDAASPEDCLPGHWPEPPAGRIGVIAVGKAAAGMAREAARHFGGKVEGIVIAPAYQEPAVAPLQGFEWYRSSHPVPDEQSVRAARAALEFARCQDPQGLLLVLISGGGSSLMSLPAEGIFLEDKQGLTRALLACGASISEINCVRKHLSGIKGGRLAAASKAPVLTLAISDVPGNDPAAIASGPTLEDRSTLSDAREVLTRYGIRPTEGVLRALNDSANETPRMGGGAASGTVTIVASGLTALEAAAALCTERGIEPIVLGDRLEGDAKTLASEHARRALRLADEGGRCCLLSGGETTVKVSPEPGIGGRNSEYALALALELGGDERIWALAADTDGIDGAGDHAGGQVGPDTLARGKQLGLDAAIHLRQSDSATYLRKAGGLLVTGPTATNVNDFRAILINPPAPLPQKAQWNQT